MSIEMNFENAFVGVQGVLFRHQRTISIILMLKDAMVSGELSFFLPQRFWVRELANDNLE
jgi:hypothetical protein